MTDSTDPGGNLGAIFAPHAAASHAAIIDLSDEDAPVEITYGALDDACKGGARALTAKGLGIGDRIGILGLNRHEYIAVMFGAMRAGQFGPALDSFNAIIDADPAFAEGWNKRATLYFYMGRYDESISDVEKTLALEPRHCGALSGMGLVHTELNDEATALEWFEHALEVNPHMPFILLRVEELVGKSAGADPSLFPGLILRVGRHGLLGKVHQVQGSTPFSGAGFLAL